VSKDVSTLGPTAWHMVFLARRQCGVTVPEVVNVCFLMPDDATRRLQGLVELGHLAKRGRIYYAAAANSQRGSQEPRTGRKAKETTNGSAAPGSGAGDGAKRDGGPASPRGIVEAAVPVAAPAPLPPVQPVPGPAKTDRGVDPAVRLASKAAGVVPVAGVAPYVAIAKAPPFNGEVIVPPNVKLTIGPRVTFDPRYQVDPASRPFGAGFSAAGVGRDLLTGQPWNHLHKKGNA
jgi:hypothetical protein